MPIKKKTIVKKSSPRKKKINLEELKKDLVDDFEQFLFEENINDEVSQQQKKKALDELDKLIKQDLSYTQILSTVKKETKNDIAGVEETQPKQFFVEETDSISSSEHVLDLRNSEGPVEKRKEKGTSKFERYKSPWTKVSQKLSQVNLQQPKLSYPNKINNLFDFSFQLPGLGLKGIGSRIAVFALIMTIILLPIRGLVLYGQVQDDKDKILGLGQQGLISLQSGVISASENSYQTAQADFEEALENFNQAQEVLNEYHQWMLNTSTLMPVVGKPVSLSRNMLTIATNISEAAAILNRKIQAQENPTEYLITINQQIEETLPYLESAQKDLDGFSTGLLPVNLQPYFSSLKVYLPETIESLDNLNDILIVMIDLLGHDAEKRYLVLFQNDNELRPTGGFIGSFAMFDVFQGKIVNLEIPRGGTYDLEAGQAIKIKAPQALSLINTYFNIWDANWWYDFPTSAEKITDLFQDSGESSVNGVIAINADVLKKLLEVLGPVILEDYNLTITSANVIDVLQEEVELNYNKEENQPKAVIADLVPVILEELLSNTTKQKEIITVFAKTLASKDIQIYSKDQELQQKIRDFGWSGQMVQSDRDYLAVINTNIGGGKTDNDVYQTIDHQSDIQANGEIINTVRITRINKGGIDNPLAGLNGGNVSYLRVHVPLGSQFIEGIGFDQEPFSYIIQDKDAQTDSDIAKEEDKMIDNESGVQIYASLDKTVFANWITLKPGETKTISVKYKLPFKLDLGDPLINDWWRKVFRKNLNLDNYNLVVQSQSGDKNTIFGSSVLLPDNIKVVWNNSSDDSAMNITDNLVTYDKELIGDQYFGFIVATK
ncbi:DUF4012 domain-containing protein [bacterium]|nr:DUF4012 domain-containing protein [bacterium]